MKKTLLLAAAALVAVLITGCLVPSVNPLFSEEQLLSYSNLVGTWKGDRGDTWSFSMQPDTKAYRLTNVDEQKRVAVFRAGVGKLGTNLFLDLTVDDLPDTKMNELASVHLIPAHVFFKLSRQSTNLCLTALDVKWLGEELKRNPKLVSHIFQQERPLLTGSTEELQRFVTTYANDTNAFATQLILQPVKAQP